MLCLHLVKLGNVGQKGVFEAFFNGKKKKKGEITKNLLKILQKQWVQTIHQLSSICKRKTNWIIVNILSTF